MDDVVSVACDYNYDPPYITITLGNPVGYHFSIPKPYYDTIRGPLGLPDVVCEGK